MFLIGLAPWQTRAPSSSKKSPDLSLGGCSCPPKVHTASLGNLSSPNSKRVVAGKHQMISCFRTPGTEKT
ncbi:unnamed protein product [Brassica oleracea var. botrytis]